MGHVKYSLQGPVDQGPVDIMRHGSQRQAEMILEILVSFLLRNKAISSDVKIRKEEEWGILI